MFPWYNQRLTLYNYHKIAGTMIHVPKRHQVPWPRPGHHDRRPIQSILDPGGSDGSPVSSESRHTRDRLRNRAAPSGGSNACGRRAISSACVAATSGAQDRERESGGRETERQEERERKREKERKKGWTRNTKNRALLQSGLSSRGSRGTILTGRPRGARTSCRQDFHPHRRAAAPTFRAGWSTGNAGSPGSRYRTPPPPPPRARTN